MQIQFLGATQTVTGSKYVITAGKTKILVDCGLFQGYKELRERNWSSLTINPAEIDAILLTHAHLDHSGYIPLLIKQGFRGKIFCTQATHDLCKLLLPDSGHLQEEDARYANLKGSSKHKPALPLYTQAEAEAALTYFEPIKLEKKYTFKDLQFTFYYASHILGAAFIRVEHQNISISFSGDLGRPNDPLLMPPHPPVASDYFVIESTYGNRLHDTTDPRIQLADIINKTAKRGGSVIIPAFAVGRAQLILYYLHELKSTHKIPNIPVFVDSPMATDATKIFCEQRKTHRLSDAETLAVCQTAQYTASVEDSKTLNTKNMPMIIISASGMATGGRVIHHIKNFAPDHRNTIVFCGFQAGGTRGDRMIRGEKAVKIFGEMVPIRAEVVSLDNMSAHADYAEMLDWLAQLKKPPKKIFITHGENQASEALAQKIEQRFHWSTQVPNYHSIAQLD